MKSIKMALLGGAALAVTAAGAQADDLEALKAQIETLNARVAAMEAAPTVPAGYQLVTIGENKRQQIPGLEMTSRERALYSEKVNTISVLPTADAPAGATITWSGFVRAGLVYTTGDASLDYSFRTSQDASWEDDGSQDFDGDDLDVYATGQLTVTATTDTAVGEVGVKIVMEANYDGIESESSEDIEFDTAWGYWSMTPELTFGGGYTGSLGNIGYGMDGACTCHYYSTVAFNPGDTSQMRLTYGSGPFSMAIALEDASLQGNASNEETLASYSDDQLGVAGEIKYSGDMFSGEISGVWRGLNDDDEGTNDFFEEVVGDDWWQVGAGVAFGLGDVASISLAAAMGEGPVVASTANGLPGEDILTFPWQNDWWGVSGIITGHLTDEFHAEVGAGYISRDFTEVQDNWDEYSAETDRWVVAGGLYYTPVDQLTIGVEASYSDLSGSFMEDDLEDSDTDRRTDFDVTDTTVAFLSVWRF
jgi:hypothetical protein